MWIELILLLPLLLLFVQTNSFLPPFTRSSRASISLPSVKRFSDYEPIPSWLLSNCDRLKYQYPTSIQIKALSKIFDGKDVIVQSPTGSGKTLLFALPILSKINWKRRAIQAVIVEPTRELALQVVDVFEDLSRGSPKKLNIMSVLEGSRNKREAAWGRTNPPQIVVGNPSSLQPLVDSGHLQLGSVSFIVLDEVDSCLLNKQTSKDLHTLLTRHLSNTYTSPKLEEEYESSRIMDTLYYYDKTKDMIRPEVYRSHRQAILCSATIPQRHYFAQTCVQNGWTETEPELIVMEDKVPPLIEHNYLECDNELSSRVKILAGAVAKEWKRSLSAKEQLAEAGSVTASDDDTTVSSFRAIVFCGSEDNLLVCHEELSKTVSKIQGDVRYLSESAMFLSERSKTLEAFRSGVCSVLVCSTNILTRGIDIPSTTHIFQLFLPNSAELYLHQAGRTGRLNRPGKVVTLVHPKEVKIVLKKYENELNIAFTKYG